MKLLFADARLWRYLIAATGKFVEVGLLEVNDDGLKFKAMDPSRTALVELIIPKEGFDAFEVSESTKLVLNIEDMSKIMRTAEKDDRIGIDWDQSSITFMFERRGVPRYFRLPLQSEATAEEIPELSIEYKNTYKVGGSVLHEAVKAIEDVGEVLKVSGNEKSLKLQSISDLGEAEIVLDLEKGTLDEASVENPGFSVTYGMEYLSYMKQPIKLADTVVIHVDTDMPLHLELNYVQGAKVNYYVAPRVE